MTSLDLKQRSLRGKILLTAGIGLLAFWAYYFVSLVRPTDIWDLCPLPIAVTLFVLGARFVGLGELILGHAAVSYKRDLALALALGTLVELSLWAFLFFVVGGDPESAERWNALERLQEPGIKIGLAAYRYSYSHLGVRLDPYAVSVCVLLVCAAIWSSAAFALLRAARLLWTRDAEPAR
jgi:hypothetical protein